MRELLVQQPDAAARGTACGGSHARAACEAGERQAQGERASAIEAWGSSAKRARWLYRRFEQLAKIRETATLVFGGCWPCPLSIRNEAMVPIHKECVSDASKICSPHTPCAAV